MEWEKPTRKALEAFDAVAPPSPVERKKMFGMPACFLNGNMFAGVLAQTIIVRLLQADRERFIEAGGEQFAPMVRRSAST